MAEIPDNIMATLSVEVHAFALWSIVGGLHLTTDPMQKLVLHYILQGSGTHKLNGGRKVSLGRGCAVVVSTGILDPEFGREQ
jgi:hypothetical protein